MAHMLVAQRSSRITSLKALICMQGGDRGIGFRGLGFRVYLICWYLYFFKPVGLKNAKCRG